MLLSPNLYLIKFLSICVIVVIIALIVVYTLILTTTIQNIYENKHRIVEVPFYYFYGSFIFQL